MKAKVSTNRMFSIIGLAVLLLVSPCKVRNFIQAEIGIPKTEVSNKSQTTVSQSNCQDIELSQVVQSTSKPTIKLHKLSTLDFYSFLFSDSSLKHSYKTYTTKTQPESEVPLYILYQNLKVYS